MAPEHTKPQQRNDHPLPRLDQAAIRRLQRRAPVAGAAIVAEARKQLPPIFPGGRAAAAAGGRCLELTGSYSPRRVLEDFAEGRTGGAAEFRGAEELRAQVGRRLAGGDPAPYYVFLHQAALHARFSETAHAAVFKAALLNELEHLPGHLQFFERYKDTEWTRRYSPSHLMRAVFDLLSYRGEWDRANPVLALLKDDLHGYLCAMKLRDLYVACFSGTARFFNRRLLCDFAARAAGGADNGLAAEIVDQFAGRYLRCAYSQEQGDLQRPLTRLSMLTGELTGAGVRNPRDVIKLVMLGVRADPSPEAAAVLKNLKTDLHKALTVPETKQRANNLLAVCPWLG